MKPAPCAALVMVLLMVLAADVAAAIAPVADAGPDVRLCDSDDDGLATVTLDATASYDPDGTLVAYGWTLDGAAVADGPTARAALPVGTHIITLTVTDDDGLTASDTLTAQIDPFSPAVQLDLTAGFNMDAIAGPREYQQCLLAGDNLGSLFGGLSGGNGSYIMGQSRHMVAVGDGEIFAYSIPTSPGHPANLAAGQGVPADGIVVADGRVYHMAACEGNATLGGDWTEVADPATYVTQPNAVVVGASHNIASWQIPAVTVELPADQKGRYGDVNFVLAAMNMADRARNMRIVALYGPDGADESVLYAFSGDDGGSGPIMLDAAPEAGFAAVLTMSKSMDLAAGASGVVRDQTSHLYAFAQPLPLDDSRALWGFRIEDAAPGLNWNSRGLAVFAATAQTPCDGLAPPVADAGPDQSLTDTDNDGLAAVTLDGTASSDDGAIVDYAWSEDGAPLAAGATAAVDLAVGDHTLTLTVTDDDGLTDSDTTAVSVLYGGVVADAGPNRNVVVADAGDPATVTLDGSRSTTPVGTITDYAWREDATPLAAGQTVDVELAYGSHAITLEVTNDLGWSDTDTITITLMTAPALTGNTFTHYKSGISLLPGGVPGVDWVFERWYHDPIVDDHGVIYINSATLLELAHNAMNRNANETDPVIGADGLDGIGDSGDEGLIRMKVDMDWSWRYRWTYEKVEGDVAPEYLVPAYTGPFSFGELTYYDGTPVVGATGPSEPLTTYPEPRSTTFYFRGLADAFGDEWHLLTVGDDDFMLYSSWYESWSSDGKIFYFVVDPVTPAISFAAGADDAQWYTTPIKAYFVPQLHEQTTYVTPGVGFALHNITNGEPVQYRIDELHGDAWLTFDDAVVPLDVFGLAADTVYTLRYRIGADGVEKTRTIHYDPAYPSDAEPHPSVVLFPNAEVEQRIRDQIADHPSFNWRFNSLMDPFSGGHGAYARPLMTGVRYVGERGDNKALNNAFCVYIDGLGAHPFQEQLARDYMLDNCLTLDPIGTEISHLTSVPCRERVGWGYYHVRAPINVALAYDLLIKDFRYPEYPNGFTAIEDYRIRDMIGAFALETLRSYSSPWPNRDGSGPARAGMWTTAREMGVALTAMVMPTYDTPYYGTSGGDGREAVHPWTPYPDTPVTWFDATMNEDYDAGIYGVLRAGDPVRWLDREGYWEGTGLMGQLYYKLANARTHWDGRRWPFFEEAFALAMTGELQSSKVQGGDDGWAYKTTGLVVNEYFPELAEPMETILTAGTGSTGEESIGETLWAQGVFALCYMRLDWRDHVETTVSGDTDGDGDVDLDDFATLKINFGTPAGATAAEGDFDGDGDVDLDDFAILKQNFGT